MINIKKIIPQLYIYIYTNKFLTVPKMFVS